MSYEYRLIGGGSAALDAISRRVAELGLKIVKLDPAWVSFAYDESDPAEVIRWGGDVRVEREGENLFVTLNAAKQREQVLALLVSELATQGICASVEEV